MFALWGTEVVSQN